MDIVILYISELRKKLKLFKTAGFCELIRLALFNFVQQATRMIDHRRVKFERRPGVYNK